MRGRTILGGCNLQPEGQHGKSVQINMMGDIFASCGRFIGRLVAKNKYGKLRRPLLSRGQLSDGPVIYTVEETFDTVATLSRRHGQLDLQE